MSNGKEKLNEPRFSFRLTQTGWSSRQDEKTGNALARERHFQAREQPEMSLHCPAPARRTLRRSWRQRDGSPGQRTSPMARGQGEQSG